MQHVFIWGWAAYLLAQSQVKQTLLPHIRSHWAAGWLSPGEDVASSHPMEAKQCSLLLDIQAAAKASKAIKNEQNWKA